MTDTPPSDQPSNGSTGVQTEGTLVVGPDQIMKAIKLNCTHGVDDRVVRAFRPFDGGEINTDVRRAFRGSERYSNPATAPMHIQPELFVSESEFRQMPLREVVDVDMMDIPNLIDDRSEEDQEKFEEAYDEVLEVWERNIRGMLVDELVIDPSYLDEKPIRFDVRYQSQQWSPLD